MALLDNDKLVLHAFATLVDVAPAHTDYMAHLNYIQSFGRSGYLKTLDQAFANISDAELAALLLQSTGLDGIDLEGDGNTDNMKLATDFIHNHASNRVGAILDLTQQLANITAGALAPIAAAYNNKIAEGYAYSSNWLNSQAVHYDHATQIQGTPSDDIIYVNYAGMGIAINDSFTPKTTGTITNDHVIEGGTGNDWIVLSTNLGTSALTSSNDTVKYTHAFGHDTIVNFAVSGYGIDQLDFTLLHRTSYEVATTVEDRTILPAPPTRTKEFVTDGEILLVEKTVSSAREVKNLFADQGAGITAKQLYLAMSHETSTIDVYQVTDGSGANDVAVSLLGNITLLLDSSSYDGRLSADNFV